mgnify:FL=1
MHYLKNFMDEYAWWILIGAALMIILPLILS